MRDAGIIPGMSVIDIGCGRGDVSMLTARLVGEQGHVLGIDRDGGVIVAARERARESALTNVAFEQDDFSVKCAEDESVDAVVGRRVLMYQPDAIAAIRMLSRVVRPGGLIVFQEHDATVGPVNLIPMPLHAQVRHWIWETVRREGADLHIGFRLAPAMTQAGFRVEQVRAEAVVQTPTQSDPLAQRVRSMLPRLVRHGVATEAEIDIDHLEERLRSEREHANTTYIGELIFGAWGRKSQQTAKKP